MSPLIRTLRNLFVSLVLTSGSVLAQTTVNGQIRDKGTDQPIPFVSVALYQLSDSTAVGGAITDSTGKYLIANTKAGSYLLRTFFVGYKPVSVPVTVVRGQPLDLGVLKLEGESRMLQEVRVAGQRSDVVVQADRQTYRAGQFQSAAGGTATDVLRNLPGLTINAEGDVSLRGANGFLVLLNGKPVQANLGTLLNQLPANSIESIEVITTPNARYDPDGKAGIIAIVTKKGVDGGWSAQVNALIGLPSTYAFGNARNPVRYSPDLTLNFRSARWDVALSSAYIRNDIAGRRVGDVTTTLGNRFTRFPSDGERSFDRHTFTNRLAIAYVPNKSNAWNLGLYQSQRTEDRIADIFYNTTTTNLNTGQLLSERAYFNSNLVRKGGRFYTANLDYTHTFLGKATLSAGALYEYDLIDGFTANRNLGQTNFRDTLQYAYSTTDRPIQNVRANLDGSLPIWGGKLEGGYQYRYQDDAGNYRFQQQDGNRQPLLIVPSFTGRTAITNHIHSWYGQFGAVRKQLDFTLGLRFEHAQRTVLSLPRNETYRLTLNNLFPSFNLLYKPQTGLALRAGFSRRVQRNSNFALNPLPEREHSETLEQGDPNLLPEFINLAEVGVTKEAGRSTLIATVYYQGIQNVVNRVNRVFADTILSRIYTNAGLAQRLGIELATDLRLTKTWKAYLGGTVYRYTQSGQLFANEVIFDRAAWVYSVNANTTVQLTPTLTFQANVNYLSRRITAQGEDSRFLTPNLSVKKSLLGSRLTVMAQWQNIGLGILPTNEQRITTRGLNFFTTTNYIQEKDIFLINLSYSLRQVSKRAKLPGNEFGDKEF
ncbi:TonB-dependent receptor [Rudanella paleaurantiibacter]|uniref:TonB-dependent receptor n=1 Tax=Rudanella paleaurantiibacter TaxID=2614655 RepID=A0A7J5U6X0_9BACT|nr:outer membrane beta-barrel family protein [Rudanella paleaurantiibacter]KAB7732900.1 TonB-dependent receptor [Rudanella paleaurantiibacter]